MNFIEAKACGLISYDEFRELQHAVKVKTLPDPPQRADTVTAKKLPDPPKVRNTVTKARFNGRRGNKVVNYEDPKVYEFGYTPISEARKKAQQAINKDPDIKTFSYVYKVKSPNYPGKTLRLSVIFERVGEPGSKEIRIAG